MADKNQKLAEGVAVKTGLDIALVLQLLTQYGPVFVALLKTLIEAWQSNPVYAVTAKGATACDPALKEALVAAAKASCETCCKIHCAAHVAGCCDE